MLKRSFAEFHAQRSHPEALQKLAEGKARLDALRARPWPHSPHATSQQDVQEYYHLCEHIRALTTHIQVSPEAPMSPPTLFVMPSHAQSPVDLSVCVVVCQFCDHRDPCSSLETFTPSAFVTFLCMCGVQTQKLKPITPQGL